MGKPIYVIHVLHDGWMDSFLNIMIRSIIFCYMKLVALTGQSQYSVEA